MIDLDDPLTGELVALEGRDDWLFLERVGRLDVLGYYTDEDKIADETIQQWAAALRRRREYFAKEGIAYQTLVVPDAHLVYRDKLPESVTLAERSPFERLSEVLDTRTRQQAVYPLDELVAGREREETYQSVDVHWNDWGGWLGYRASIEALARTVPAIQPLDADRVTWSVQPTFGGLGATVTPERFAQVPVATVKDPKSKPSVRLVTERRHVFLVVEQDAPALPSALVFRDSFMTEPARFYSESFRRIVFVTASSAIYYDLVDWEQPDVVIHEMGERRLASAPVEPSTKDFRFIFGDLLIDDPQAETDQRRSRTMARDGRFDDALEASDSVMLRVPSSARLLLHRARLHIFRGQNEAALEALRHATTLDPGDAAPWHLLGHVLDQLDRLYEASEAFARAARAEPRQVEYWQMAMSGALKSGDTVAAEQLRKEAFAEHPDNAAISNAASWVFAATDRLDEAENAAAFAARTEPRSDAHLVLLASIQIRRGRWEAAATTVDDLRVLGSVHPSVQHYEELVNSHFNAPPGQKSEGTA